MIGGRRFVVQQNRRTLAVYDQYVYFPVVVIVADSEAASDNGFLEDRPGLRASLFQHFALPILEQLGGLPVRGAFINVRHVVLHMPVREYQVEETIIVVIQP